MIALQAFNFDFGAMGESPASKELLRRVDEMTEVRLTTASIFVSSLCLPTKLGLYHEGTCPATYIPLDSITSIDKPRVPICRQTLCSRYWQRNRTSEDNQLRRRRYGYTELFRCVLTRYALIEADVFCVVNARRKEGETVSTDELLDHVCVLRRSWLRNKYRS